MLDFFFDPTATAYGQRPKFVRAELSAMAEGENWAFGSTLLIKRNLLTFEIIGELDATLEKGFSPIV